MSLQSMIMGPDRAKDLHDMMNKLDRWDALIVHKLRVAHTFSLHFVLA